MEIFTKLKSKFLILSLAFAMLVPFFGILTQTESYAADPPSRINAHWTINSGALVHYGNGAHSYSCRFDITGPAGSDGGRQHMRGWCVQPAANTSLSGKYEAVQISRDEDRGIVTALALIAGGEISGAPSDLVNKARDIFNSIHPNLDISAHLAAARAANDTNWSYGAGDLADKTERALPKLRALLSPGSAYKKNLNVYLYRLNVPGRQDLYMGWGWYRENSPQPDVRPDPKPNRVTRRERTPGEPYSERLEAHGRADLTITKKSGNESITNNNPAYDLSTVTFTLSGPNGSETKTLGNASTITFSDLTEGTYTLQEVTPGIGYERAAPQTINITVNHDYGRLEGRRATRVDVYEMDEDGSNRSLVDSYYEDDAYETTTWESGGSVSSTPTKYFDTSVTNTPILGSLKFEKKSKNEAMTKGLKNITTSGAKYRLSHKHINKVYEFTTDNEGKYSINDMPLGEYEVTEIENSTGYIVEKVIKPVRITADSEETRNPTFIHKETPSFIKAPNLVKVDDKQYRLNNNSNKPQGDGELKDAIFTVKLYDEDLNKDSIAGKEPALSFEVKTLLDNAGNAKIQWDKNHIIANTFVARNGSTLNDYFVDDNNVPSTNGTFKLPLGTLVLQEKTAPTGYKTDTVSINSEGNEAKGENNLYIYKKLPDPNNRNNTTATLIDLKETPIISEKTQVLGGVKVEKHDSKTHNTTPQGDANLKSTFEIYNTSKNAIFIGDKKVDSGQLVTTIETNDKPIAQTDVKYLPYGSYAITEVSTDKTYKLVQWSKNFEIRQDGQVVNFVATDEGAPENEVKRGGVTLQKFDKDFLESRSQGDATLAGAEFTIVNKSKQPVYNLAKNAFIPVDGVVDVIRTDANGLASSTANLLPIGTYEIKETKPSKGYLLNEKWIKTFRITEDAQIVNLTEMPTKDKEFNYEVNEVSDTKATPEKVIRGDVLIKKSDKDRIVTDPDNDDNKGQGDATLAGAKFNIINVSSHPVFVENKEYAKDSIVKVITTDKTGIAKTEGKTLPYGTYKVVEASAPDGYFVDEKWSQTFSIREEGVTVEPNDYKKNPVKEVIIRGGAKFQKIDKERNEAIPQGDATLEGAEIDIYNNSEEQVYVKNKWVDKDQVVMTIRTDKSGKVKTGSTDLPYGSYYAKEKTPSKGYLLNPDWRVDFKIRTQGQVEDLETRDETKLPQQVIRGDVLVTKFDKELDKSEAIAGKAHGNNTTGTNLNGIVFDITNRSVEKVMVDGKLYEPGQVVKSITTSWDDQRKAYIAKTEGKALPYGTYEIKEVKTNKFYNLTDTQPRTFQIREEGKVVETDTDNANMIFKNYVVRGDLEFRKIAEFTHNRMSTLWMLENVTTGETHMLFADKNGELYTSSDKGFKHTQDTNANDKFLDKAKAGEEIAIKDANEESGVWFGLGEDKSMALVRDDLGALPYGEYRLREVRTDSNRNFDLKDFNFYIYRQEKTVDVGTITNVKVEIGTKALDDATGLNMGSSVGENTTIVDTVYYKNIKPGKTYTMKASLLDKVSGEILAKADKEFKPGSRDGEVDVNIELATSKVRGKTVVVFEELFDGTMKIAEHTDINDEKQTVVYPEIKTSASSVDTKAHDAQTSKTTKIIDKVSYSNLIPGKSYEMTGTLMDKSTKKPLDGTKVTKKFTAEAANGYVDLEFVIDSSKLGGQTLVAFESLKYRNVEVAVHADINDHDQSVYFPEIKTLATSNDTKDKDGVVSKTTTIIDKVSYKNLLPETKYIIEGRLVDKTTKAFIKGSDDKDLVVRKEFTTTDKDGVVEMEFSLNSEKLRGKDTVVYEKLYRVVDGKEIELTSHEDIDDEGQTVHFPYIKTTLTDKVTNSHNALAGEKTTLVDKVKYSNLIVGKKYTMSGTLMDKSTKAPILDKNQKPITASQEFTADKTDGFVDITFEFDSSAYVGKTLVAFESLKRDKIELVTHADINDESQTVYFPQIKTTLQSDKGLKSALAAEKTTLIDKVEYKNLFVGKKYNMTGKLVMADTLGIKDVTKEVSVEFTPKAVDGFVDVKFEFDARDLAGRDVVAFEKLEIINDKEVGLVAKHEDIKDKGQTVSIPKIRTTLTDAVTKNHIGSKGQMIKLVDKVSYTNLIVGKNYTVSGELMYKDGKPAGIKASKSFTAKEKDGFVEVEFVVDTSKLTSKALVAFEEMNEDKTLIAVHKDIEDKEQTVHFPEIKTQAIDEKTKTHQISDDGDNVTIIDKVSYKGLLVGQEYEMTGKLMDKATSNPLLVNGKEVTSSLKFKADKEEGFVEIKFTIPNKDLNGKTLVAFEKLLYNGVEIATHEDIEDKDQSVHKLLISTLATGEDGQSKLVDAKKSVTVKDKVTYENIVLGDEYKVVGSLVDKSTSKEVSKTELKYTPKEAKGDFVVEFKNVDLTKYAGKTLVVTQKVYDKNGALVANHSDLSDTNQSITVKSVVKVNTGVKSNMIMMSIVAVSVLALAAFIFIRARLYN